MKPPFPWVEIKADIPGDVMPIGYNVTLTCVGRMTRFAGGLGLVNMITWWRGGEEPHLPHFIIKCGGDRVSDEEELKTCGLNIINGTSNDTGEYRCEVWDETRCSFQLRNFTWLGELISGTALRRDLEALRSTPQFQYHLWKQLPFDTNAIDSLLIGLHTQ